MAKIAIVPFFRGADRGDGGIRRVVEAQTEHLPKYGWELVDDPREADIVAAHAGYVIDVPATTPLVSHCHGLYWYGYKWEQWALGMNRDVIKMMRRADAVTAPSKWVAHAIQRGTQISPMVLYHGVNFDQYENFAGDDSGYVFWNKTRVDPICDPFPLRDLAIQNPQTHFVSTVSWPFEGASAYPPVLNVEVAGVGDHAHSREWLRHCAVYLCTTRETFGIGTIEAMAYGKPILAYDHGGQSEIVTHKVNGYLATPGDVDDLSVGLAWCLEHRADAGVAARAAVAERFTWDIAIKRYDILYRSLIDLARAPQPKVSVVIPYHNLGGYLEDAIASVATASEGMPAGSVEVVLVDDASDKLNAGLAREVVKAGVVSDLLLTTNTSNLYLAETLNAGIQKARGRYIVPLDADNMLGGAGVLSILVDALDNNRDIDIAYGSMSVIEVAENNREWVSTWPQQFNFRRQMLHQNQIPSTSMYRRRIWDRVGGYRRRCRTAEDADFWCRATSFGANAMKVTDAVVLRYRNRADSMSHVVEDWPWHEWYPWHRDTSLTPWLAPVDNEREDPVVPAYETPIVSVIIPVGPGHERYVLDALDSLNAQTFRWWEAIVVDDTNDGIPWLPSWAQYVSTTGGVGAGAARNAGLDAMHPRSQYFVFLDADDYFQPRALEIMLAAASKFGGFVYTDWFKQESGEVYHAPDWDGCDSVLRQLPWPVTCMYPRAVAEAVDGFDVTLPAWEDWDYAIKVVLAGYCGTRIDAPLFHYRIGSGSRREAGFAERDSLKETIYARYAQYIKGDTPMPCGCAGGGGLPTPPPLDFSAPSIVQPTLDGAAGNDMTLLEYTNTEIVGPLTYIGKVTGTKYRFGYDEDNRVRWVYSRDIDSFLTRGEFKVYNPVEGEARLAAAGPPR